MLILLTLFAFANVGNVLGEADVTVYMQDNFKGEKFVVTGLNKIGDCADFWSPHGGIDPEWAKYNDRTRSIKLGEGVCVRLYEHDCPWEWKGRTLDTTPNSPWAKAVSKELFAGIISGIELIECPPPTPPLVSLFSQTNFKGDRLDLTGLRKIGDCEELWNPSGFQVIISDDRRHFNDRAQSIQLAEGVCVRAYADQCDSDVRLVDVKPDSPWAKDLDKDAHFRNIISAVEMIQCPVPSGIVVYDSTGFKGQKLMLDDLRKPGDCMEFWDQTGYKEHISDQYRWFNDRPQSIEIPSGQCVTLYENGCGGPPARDLEVCSDDKWAKNLGSKSFGGIVSAVELTKSSAPPPPAPLPPQYVVDPSLPPLYVYDPPVIVYQNEIPEIPA